MVRHRTPRLAAKLHYAFIVKVLIATDGSNEATTALRTAARLLSPIDRNLDILCVAPAYHRRAERGRREYERRILSETTHILEQARSNLSSGAGTMNLLSEIGSPSAVIVDKAEDYDLTVVGPKGRGVTSNIGLGPVASRVVEHALAPVLVGKELRNEDGVRVLVAVDGSTASLHAVEALRSLFDLSSAEVCLMHVAETPWIQLGLEEDWTTYSDEDKESSEAGVLAKELVREGKAVIEQARNLLRGHGVSVSTRIDEGNPANEILSEAERGQYDLVVVGATGNRDLKHRMLGSVSTKIAWDAPCSVLIAREPEGSG
jgi:nucleotide-binding universal stress UspA family protein